MLKNIKEEFKRFREVLNHYKENKELRMNFIRFILVMILKFTLWGSMMYLGYVIIQTLNTKAILAFILLLMIWLFNQKIHKKLAIFMDAECSEKDYLIYERAKLEKKIEILNKQIYKLEEEKCKI